MPHSTLHHCNGCDLAIAGDERVTEYLERMPIDNGEATVVVRPRYTHVGHEDMDEALDYGRTGRQGVLDDLRDTWVQPPEIR